MANIFYDRSAVPVTEKILLEVQFKDSAGHVKDADTDPQVEITDAATTVVSALSSSGVIRTGVGRYRLDFTVPSGYTAGLWNDNWQAQLDGYTISNYFDFNVTSVGTVEETGSSVPVRQYTLEDPDLEPEFTQAEIKGILLLRGLLKEKLRSTAFKTDGSTCPVFSDAILNHYLYVALSEFNATPTLTSFTFADIFIQTIAADIITEGAMLIAWSGQAIIEAGFEYSLTDQGVTANPPPLSATINTLIGSHLSDYRGKLKEIKRNLRGAPIGLGAGRLLVASPQVMRLRHLKERRII